MKNSLWGFLLFCLLGMTYSFAQTAFDENIHNYEKILHYDSDIKIERDDVVEITETIEVVVLGREIQRGIFRTLPLKRELNGKKYSVKYEVIEVLKDGEKEKYTTSRSNNDLEIRIGNKNKLLDKGIYVYTIRYKTGKQIGFFEDFDEFYWNVNGEEWDFSIDRITAKVELPQGANIIQNQCYTGGYGSQERDCNAIVEGNTIHWEADHLRNWEGLTVAVGFDKGFIDPPPPPTFLEEYGLLGFLILSFIVILAYLLRAWIKYGIDPPKPTVIPQFYPPEKLSPASLGYLRKEGFANDQVTAALVSLGVKGYIKFEEKSEPKLLGISKKKTFILNQLKQADNDLPLEEQSLMSILFSNSSTVTIDGKYDALIAKALEEFKKALGTKHNRLLRKGNNLRLLRTPALLAMITVVLGSFIVRIVEGTWDGAFFIWTAMVIIGFFTAGLTYALNSGFNQREGKKGCLVIFQLLILLSVIFTILGVGYIVALDEISLISYRYIFGFMVSMLPIFLIFGYLIKKPAKEKLQVQADIEGFKMYMGAAENLRIRFENPPKTTPELFEKYLPFAMVLGVDKIWGDHFQQMWKKMSVDPYQQTWYTGSSVSSYSLGNHMKSSFTQSFVSTSTAPSASGGSGGGGFSGGGGGGGGGGGW